MAKKRLPLSQFAWASRLSDVWDIGVVVLGSDQNVDFASARARRLLAVETDDELRQRWRRLANLLAAQLREAVPGNEKAVEATISKVDGDVKRDLRVQIYAIEEDECVGHLLLLQDADRAAAIQSSLRHATRNRSLASLYLDTAHDLKGGLNIVSMNLELLSRVAGRPQPTADDASIAVRCLDVMRRELARLDRAIEILLDRNTLERDDPGRIDVRRLCENLAGLVAARAGRQRVSISIESNLERAEFVGFPDQIHGALLNLVINALDAMPNGGALQLRVHADATTVRVDVCDSGGGIPENRLADIWRLHFTTKPGGTGIGLYVSRSIIEAHGGHIECVTGPDGTCFVSTFPITPDS